MLKEIFPLIIDKEDNDYDKYLENAIMWISFVLYDYDLMKQNNYFYICITCIYLSYGYPKSNSNQEKYNEKFNNLFGNKRYKKYINLDKIKEFAEEIWTKYDNDSEETDYTFNFSYSEEIITINNIKEVIHEIEDNENNNENQTCIIWGTQNEKLNTTNNNTFLSNKRKKSVNENE